ncbi:hypothetical protein Bca4012_004441 [Brassica carinata]
MLFAWVLRTTLCYGVACVKIELSCFLIESSALRSFKTVSKLLMRLLPVSSAPTVSSVIVGLFTAPFVSRGRMEHV